MRKLLVLILIVPSTLAGNIEQAQAHLIAKPKCDKLSCIEKSQTRNLAHAKGFVAFARKMKVNNRRVYWHWRASKWLEKELRETKNALNPYIGYPPHYNEWLCIHSHEGAWDDPNAPYYGGLQMDWEFMQTYGPTLLLTKGTADNWTPLEQMWVAERAYASGRGFYPWPNTARYCGLI